MGDYVTRYRYNSDAIDFIGELSLFDIEKFESWLDGIVLQIGQQNVIQYIEESRRWNTQCVPKGTPLKCDYSAQAKSVIKCMTDFDDAGCKVWFSNALRISKNDILNYLSEKR